MLAQHRLDYINLELTEARNVLKRNVHGLFPLAAKVLTGLNDDESGTVVKNDP